MEGRGRRKEKRKEEGQKGRGLLFQIMIYGEYCDYDFMIMIMIL